MKRHIIWGKFNDNANPPEPSKNEQLTIISMVPEDELVVDGNELIHGIGDALHDLRSKGLKPSAIGVDLVILATLVNAADTRISRRVASQDSWTREIDIHVPVSNVKKWNSVKDLLCEMLKFLTGDIWRIEFRQGAEILGKDPRTAVKQFTSVSLFSGGLDSYIGAIDLLAGKKEEPLFIGHRWDLSTSKQILCAEKIKNVYYKNDDFPFIRARVGFGRKTIKGTEYEDTLRGRSFLFFALASLAASGSKKIKTIYVPENGLISLNVPLDPLRLGALSTKTTHPFYMERWNELLKKLGFWFSLDNPYRFKTKGEMVKGCKNATLLEETYEYTISCSSPTKVLRLGKKPGYISDARHCGYCVPCIIRKAAIKHFYKEDKTKYFPVLSFEKVKELDSKNERGISIRAFQYMKSNLSKSKDRYKILVRTSGPLIDYSQKEIKEYAEVFKRGIDEVYAVIKNVSVKP